MQNELRCVNLIGRSRRTWKTNQITPAYLKSASLKQHDREPTCEEYYNGFKKESQFSPSMQHASWKGEVITRVDEKKKNFGLRQEADVNEVFVRSTPRPMHVHWTKETRWWSFMSPLNEDPSILQRRWQSATIILTTSKNYRCTKHDRQRDVVSNEAYEAVVNR